MPRVLVIDDDRLVGEATQIMLRAKGFDVAVVQEGKAGIAAVKAGGFDVAIVDLFMPNMDGLSVMQAIRREDPNLPMIAASGFMFKGFRPDMPEFESMALEAGAAATLYKPFKPNEVMLAVEKAMRTTAMK